MRTGEISPSNVAQKHSTVPRRGRFRAILSKVQRSRVLLKNLI